MDRNIVEAKLESLRRCVDRIAEKTPASSDQLIHDPDLQDIIALNPQRAVQTSVDLAAHVIAESDSPAPSTMVEHFEILDHLHIISPPGPKASGKPWDSETSPCIAIRRSTGASCAKFPGITSTTSSNSLRQSPSAFMRRSLPILPR